MATPLYARSLVSLTKRLRLSPPTPLTTPPSSPSRTPRRNRTTAPQSTPPDLSAELQKIRLPRAVQSTYLSPLRRAPHPTDLLTCELQLRSYSIRNLELVADMAVRAAYYLKLSALGPVPLPKITERWTVPRSSFVHKKSQENFERVTRGRGVRILGGHPETVAVWLGVVKKWGYYGVGMKANVFESSGLEVAEDLDAVGEGIGEVLAETAEGLGKLPGFLEGFPGGRRGRRRELEGKVLEGPFKQRWGGAAAMGAADFALLRAGEARFQRVRVVGQGVERRMERQREAERARAQGRDVQGLGEREKSS